MIVKVNDIEMILLKPNCQFPSPERSNVGENHVVKSPGLLPGSSLTEKLLNVISFSIIIYSIS